MQRHLVGLFETYFCPAWIAFVMLLRWNYLFCSVWAGKSAQFLFHGQIPLDGSIYYVLEYGQSREYSLEYGQASETDVELISMEILN